MTNSFNKLAESPEKDINKIINRLLDIHYGTLTKEQEEILSKFGVRGFKEEREVEAKAWKEYEDSKYIK